MAYSEKQADSASVRGSSDWGERKMKKTLVLALGLASLAATAHAADMNLQPQSPVPFYDPLPDSLTWHGITFYATLDVGYAYQTNGRPTGAVVSTLEFIPFTTTRNYTGQAISTIAANGLQQSNIGLRVNTPIGGDWRIVGQLETGFDPLTGELANGCSSFVQNAGLTYTAQNSNADSGRCGQPLNAVAFGGISNSTYGQLTIGRQQSFQLDQIAIYDPMNLSYAFSLLGYSGTNGGSGSTQAARWDNSAKYVYTYGDVFHAGAMYSMGGQDTGMFGDAFGFLLGGRYQGFSIDATYTKEHGAVNLQTAVNDTVGSTTLAANISDNTAWSIMAKYTFDLGGHSVSPMYTKAARAPDAPGDKLSFFAGYTHIDQANPNNPILSGTTAGGFILTVSGTLPDNNAFTTDKIFQFYWAGAKYEMAWGLNLVGAYYHVNQNSYVADNAGCPLGGASTNHCAGTFDQVSFLADYIINKHLDVYAGITYGIVENGLASQFPGTPGAKFGFAGTGTSVNTTSMMTGFRVKI
jgi:predicted porin